MKIEKLNEKLKKIDPSIHAVEEDGCLKLFGEVEDYQKSILAAKTALNKKKYIGLINDIKYKDHNIEMKIPSIKDNSLDGERVDVLVIGGGISGASVLRELSRYKLNTLLIEKGPDLASGQTSRNGGVVHVGINFSKSSLKFKYCVLGNKMYHQLSQEMNVPFENKGQVTFARTHFEKLILRLVALTGKNKGINQLKVLSRKKLLEIEPSVPEWSVGGLFMGTGGITCPYLMNIALAENAVENGARVSLNTACLAMKVENGKILEVKTNRGIIYPKVVINASGIFADVIAEMANDRTFSIHPRIGTDIIFDKKVGHLVNTSMGKTPFTLTPRQIASLPKKPFAKLKATIENLHSHSKGIGLIHSVDGNMLVGPNADETYSREDISTNAEVVNNIILKQKEVQPLISHKDVIAYFTGIRSPVYEEDFVVRQGLKTKNIFEIAGIQSPGVTAAPAIGKEVATWVKDYLISLGNDVQINDKFNPIRQCGPKVKSLSFDRRDTLIKKNPNYGEIVCRCEEITKGEIIDCLHSPIPVYTVDGIKRRLRPGMGRCQGSFCLPLVMKIIAEETHQNMEDVVKGNKESIFVFGKTK